MAEVKLAVMDSILLIIAIPIRWNVIAEKEDKEEEEEVIIDSMLKRPKWGGPGRVTLE